MNLHLSDDVLPLTLRPAVPVNDEDLMRLSAENSPYRLERTARGEIVVMTPVGGTGSTHEAFVFGTLYIWSLANAHGLAFSSNAGFNLPDGSCLAPDAAWLSLPRWQALTPEQQAGYPPLCPEFIIEIRSRTDSRRLLDAKMQLWLDNGAELAWLIDPIDREAVVFTPHQTPLLLAAPAELRGAGPLEGFTLPLSRLW